MGAFRRKNMGIEFVAGGLAEERLWRAAGCSPRSVVIPASSSSDGRRNVAAPTGVKVANSTPWPSQCSWAHKVSRRPVKAARGTHRPPSMRHPPRKEKAATGLVSGRCTSRCRPGNSTTRKRLMNGRSAGPGTCLKTFTMVRGFACMLR
jgi:hypothetical protein